MPKRRKTWQEKLADKEGLPKILKLKESYPCYNALHKMGAEAGDDIVLVNPSEVVERMRNIPSGRLTTTIDICRSIAAQYGVMGCCSLTAGIFVMTVAQAVEEAKQTNGDFNIPYWRTLKSEGFLNEKFPGGAAAHKQLLESEGFTVIQKGKRFRVENYQDYLVREREP
jgi:alkylated DNA nucleotide flippase Atl1